MSIRTAVLALALLVGAAACSDTSDPEATSSTAQEATPSTVAEPTQAEFVADVALIKELWSGEVTAFADGFDTGIDYWVEHNYPAMGCTYEDYLETRFSSEPVEGLRIERFVNESSITREDGWVVPGGVLAGQPIDGRIYAMSVHAITTTPGEPLEPVSVRNLHVSILDGKAHFFLGCPA